MKGKSYVIDTKWKEHLYQLDSLREGIGLRAYGQRDPLVEYKREAFGLFDQMTESIKQEVVELIFKIEIQHKQKFTSVFSTENQKLVHEEASLPAGNVPGPPQEQQPQGQLATQAPPPQQGQKPQPFQRTQEKVGRNDPCPCGSGKKYKKCCGA